MITAEVVKHSMNPNFPSRELDGEIVTFVLEYPRFIHAELLTHRCFSRNCASSRAIPVERQLKMIEENEAHPIKWGLNKSGMQSEVDHEDPERCRTVWWRAAVQAAEHARRLLKLNLHKQIANRVIEPYVFMRTVLTVNDNYGLKNFFAQRAHKCADPTFQIPAYKMLDAYLKSQPKMSLTHMPFVEETENVISDAIISSAKCAAVSYKRNDDNRTNEEWEKLFNKLVKTNGGPMHLSPLEHCAFASDHILTGHRPSDRSNFRTWNQFRKRFESAHGSSEINLEKILEEREDWVKEFV
jgi:thymidylate synthase ThyX